MFTITTSWDDGDVLDKRIANLLNQYGLKGTFYVPRDYWGDRLSDEAIKILGDTQEIGAHTLTHADLKAVSLEAAREEVQGSMAWLERITGKRPQMFCYPRGRYTPAIRNLVAEAGFKGARTTKMFSMASVQDPFQIETTIQVYPYPIRHGAGIRAMLEPLRERSAGFRSLGVPIFALRNWETATRAAFDSAYRIGSIFHIWGHSWEVDKYDMWEPLENIFRYLSHRSDCRYVVNSELV